jgi:hypothetical protein
MRSTRCAFALAVVFASACSPQAATVFEDVPSIDVAVDRGVVDAPPTPLPDVQRGPDVVPLDVVRDVTLAPDAACTAAGVMAAVERLPVDIIWMVDNSASMAPAIEQVIAGLNRFAQLVDARGLDYRVVMLSLRNRERAVTVMGAARYAVCIPRPLAGDDACGNGARFFHANVDVRSTQPLEQFLGTLGQTRGYTTADPRGGEAWRPFLRANATKTLVVVTDDQSRLSADDFERFRGGTNPNSSTFSLPPGVLDPSWAGLFVGYTFAGIYGWGSDTDPGARCTYMNGIQPPSPGPVYTTLVGRTNGVRARICDGASAWMPFFESVTSAVVRASRIACEVAMPAPPAGQVLDVARINVAITGPSGLQRIGKVRDPSACGPSGGWHYDNDVRPTRVVLCPVSCERAQAEVRGGGAGIQVLFGCQTIPG